MASILELMNALSRGGAAVLADAGVKSAVVLLAAAIAARILRQAPAAVRHRVWSLGLCGALVMPLLSWMLPQMRLPVLPAKAAPAETAGESGGATPTEFPGEVAAIDSIPRDAKAAPFPDQRFEWDVAAANPIRAEDLSAAQAAILESRRDEGLVASSRTAAPRDARVYVLGAWMAGLAMVLAPLAAGFGANWLLLRKSRRLSQARWLRLIAELSARIGLKRTVAAFESPQPVVPMTWGLLRPIILVPEDWRDWPHERQRCVLLHELAHVKRLDVACQMIGRLVAAFYWFNPLVWFAVRQLRIERELACDDCVLASGERASDYARELLKIAKLYRLRPLAVGVAMARSARLDQRVLRILDQARSRLPMSPHAARSLFVAAAVLVLGVAATSLVERSTSALAREQAAAAPEADKANEIARGKVTVRGVVLTPDGEPAAGARVYALEAASSPFLPFLGNEKVRVLAETRAANDGAFSLSYTEPEKTDQHGVNQSALVLHAKRFVATADGYAIGLASTDDHRDAIRIQLAPPQALAGRLIDLEGRPLAGAAIHVKAIAQAGEPLDAWFTRAKANSRPDEQMQFAMRKAGERRSRPVSFPSKEKVSLAATPLAATATTDRDGRFSIPNIGPDRLAVLEVADPAVAKTIVKMVSHRGPDVYDVLPDPGLHDRMIHGADATIVVGPAAAVKGVVADAETGHTIADCRVEVTQVAGEIFAAEGFAQTTTDQAGRYLLGRLPLDPPDSRGYRLRFTPPAGAPYFSTEFEVRLGGANFETTFDVRLPRARFISGRITDNATSRPVRALVGYLPTYDNKGASAYPNFQPQMRTVALGDFRFNEADGSFHVPAINGRGVLCVAAERTAAYALAGHADRIEGLQGKGGKFGLFHLWDASMCNEFREVNLTDEDPDPSIDVELRPLSHRTVRLVDAEGRPLVGCLATGQMPDIAFAARQNMSDYPPLGSAETEVIGLEVESPRVLAFYQPERNLGATAVLHQEDEAHEPITISLQPCGRILGRVLDATGKPAPGRQVYAHGLPPVETPQPEHKFGPVSFRVFTETVNTDADGRFEIGRGVLPGVRYQVAVLEDDLSQDQPAGDERAAPPPKKDTPVVEPGQTVNVGDLGAVAQAEKSAEPIDFRGRVIGPHGKPVADARVFLIRFVHGLESDKDKLRIHSMTRPDGSFELRVPAEATFGVNGWSVVATRDGYGPGWTGLEPSDQTSNLTLKLARDAGPVEGRVIDMEGRPIVGMKVHVLTLESFRDDDPQPYLDSLKKGEKFRLTGRGLAADRPGDDRLIKAVQTDAQGNFKLYGVGQNRLAYVTLVGEGVEHSMIEVVTHAVPDGLQTPDHPPFTRHVYGPRFTHVARPSRTIVGVVTDAKTGAPVAGATVQSFPGWIRVVTGADGRFSLSGCPKADDYRLLAIVSETGLSDAGPYIGGSATVRDNRGLAPLEANLHLYPAVLATGRVVDQATRRPVAADVAYYPLYPNKHDVARIASSGARAHGAYSDGHTDLDGRFSLAVLPGPGCFCVKAVNAKRYAPAQVDLPAFLDQQGIVVDMEAPGQASQYLRDSGFPENKAALFTGAGGGTVAGMQQSQFHAVALFNVAEDAKKVVQDIELKDDPDAEGE